MEVENYDNPMSAIASTQDYIINLEKNDGDWLLEAGCGSLSRINIPEGFRIAGIDISEKQLNRNASIEKKICGDIQTFELEKNKFKLCICWDVLEHLEKPEKALNNLMNSLAIGGTIILAMPNIRSLKGLITKFSPHWFHVFYYKYILRDPHAGIPGYAPYPTYYHPVVSRKGIADFCSKNGLSLIYESADSYHIPGTGLTKFAIQLIKRVLSVLSLGKLSYKHTNLLFVLEKLNKK